MTAPNLMALRARQYGAVNWVGLGTLLEREISRFLKVAAQTLVAPLVSSVLFMMVFSIGFAGRGAPIGDVRFVDFLAPGLMMMGIINNAFANSSSSLIIAKVQGNATDFLMPPLAPFELAIAFIGGAAVRGVLVGAASAIALAFFADVTPTHWLAALYFAVLAAVIFGALGLLGGIWADKFDHLAAFTNFVVTPLTFLSGTFYAVDSLPPPLDTIGHWNPVFWLIDGFRFAFIGQADGDLVVSALAALGLAAGLCWLCWATLRSGWRLKA